MSQKNSAGHFLHPGSLILVLVPQIFKFVHNLKEMLHYFELLLIFFCLFVC